ncbi:MAG TPA: glutamate synthase subunit beta [Vicinamibacterales bacterium]|nr:glutamate synthase subunit beta [Vicinamibacterales bacterium]
MGKVTGFLEIARQKPSSRPIAERIRDWREVPLPYEPSALKDQTARCMDCGIPFCHHGCPLGNLIPDWNDLVYRDRWHTAIDRLHATNNFPEFTGRLCPAPCEGSCVLGINDSPVTIKSAEVAIIERAFAEGWVGAQPPATRTGKRVAVVGSGPSGLAAADQLNRAGHDVTVFERADRIGGLLRYGIPAFKLEKRFLERRLALMREEGVVFQTSCHIGVNRDAKELKREFDAIVLAGGSTMPRDLRVPGRELAGIHFAMEYLTAQNRACEGDPVQTIDARRKHVIIIGGGDTGADCLGTAHRQGARSVRQLELLQRPPDTRARQNPWPTWPNIFRVSSAHEEGGERHYAIATERFSTAPGREGQVARLHAACVDTKDPMEFDADLVLLAMGFVGPERNGVIDALGVELTERGTVARNEDWMTNVPGVFATGDMQRGQSLIVWAIADGRSCARGVDAYLTGSSSLPAPVA